MSPTVSWILLTTGNRPGELREAIASIPGPPDESTEIVVVANGAGPLGLGPEVGREVIVVDSPVNLGIPGGRNLGASRARGQVLVFLDDDATVAAPEAVSAAIAALASTPRRAVVSFRIVDPVSGSTARRHVPRLSASNPQRSGAVTSFLGGACAIRRAAFDEVGGYPDEFVYALEETDLAWRLVDAGWSLHYDGDAVIHHPATEISRHGDAHRRTARNRVLLARRLLPAPVAALYVIDWGVVTLLRGAGLATARDWWAGTRDGLAATVERRPIGWRTVWRLTRLGRPPVI